MKVLFISPNKETINMLTLPLGLGCVAAATRTAGHDVKVVDLLTEGGEPTSVRHALQRFRPAPFRQEGGCPLRSARGAASCR